MGVITRIEAFLNSLQHRPAVALPTDFNIEQVDIHPCRLAQTPSPNVPLYLPAMGAYTPYLAAYFKQQGADPYELPHLTDDILSLGRAETSAKNTCLSRHCWAASLPSVKTTRHLRSS